MAKDINIHIKTPGAQQSKQNLDKLGQSAKNAGDKAAGSSDKASEKLKKQSGILTTLKTQVLGFVGAWLGMQGVQKVISYIIQQLEKVKQLQSDIYNQSVKLSEIGQALEFQTGTSGKQEFWTQQALQLQKAGGLSSPQVAQQMMISADIAFAEQGGVKSKPVRNLLQQLAPFFGAAQLGPDEVAKVFEFGGTAGIASTEDAYKQFLAQLQAGYTASKATNFGQFMEGLQKGGTAYMTQGGSLTQAISAFSGARSMMENEATAATLLEQVSRLSSGAYAKPRAAIESGLGVQWSQLDMDQRLQALLSHVGGIPESQRAQILAEQGFPAELIIGTGKMVTSEARKTMAATREQVSKALPLDVDVLGSDYMQSMLGKQQVQEAEIALGRQQVGPELADWQLRIKKARAEHEILATTGKDRWILDKLEPYVMALEQLRKEAEMLDETPETKELLARIDLTTGSLSGLESPIYSPGMANRWGYLLTEEYQRLQQGGPATNEIHYHQDTNYHPRTGSDESGPRVAPGIK